MFLRSFRHFENSYSLLHIWIVGVCPYFLNQLLKEQFNNHDIQETTEKFDTADIL